MSYSIKKELPEMAGAFDPIIFSNYETTYATIGFKFRYIYKVSVYSGAGLTFNDITTIRKFPNNQGVGIVDISRTVQPYVKGESPTDPTYTSSEIASPVDTYAWVKLYAGYEYATTEFGEVTEYFQGTAFECLCINGTFFAQNKDLSSNYLLSKMCLASNADRTSNWIPSAIGMREDKALESRLPVRVAQGGSVGLFNVNFTSTDLTRDALYINVGFYNDSTLDTEVSILLSDIGVSTAVNTFSDVGSPVYQLFLYPSALESSGNTALNPSSYPNATRYEVRFSVGVNTQFVSRSYWFDIKQNTNCQRGMYVRWLNQFGTWDYFFFDGQVSESQSIVRSNYQTIRGNWFDSDGTNFDMLAAERGSVSMVERIEDKFKMTSGWLSDNQSDMLRSMLRSKNVEAFWFETEATPYSGTQLYYPVVITTSSVQYKKTYPNKLFSYDIEFKYANAQRTTY